MRQEMVAMIALMVCAGPLAAQPPVFKSAQHDFRMVTVADGLDHPWSMAFLPGGDMLITERPGRLRLVRNGKLLPTPVSGVPQVMAKGQGGLLDVVLHPKFATNHLVYLSYSKPTGGDSLAATTAVARGRFEGGKLTGVEDIFVALTKGAPGHFGSRLAFDKDGYLFITVGERMVPSTGDLSAHPAQDLSNHHGKIIRLFDDGRVPPDNPFVGKAGARPEIWTYGHRNPQGLAIDPSSGEIWETEHGPQGGDELNNIRRGLNYGWPVIGFGVNYGTGSAIHAGTIKAGMEQPVHVWVPSIGTSGLAIYTGAKFPNWKGSALAGGLSGQQLVRLTINGKSAEFAEILFRRQGRVRAVREGPDGYVYVAFDGEDKPTAVVRLEPVARR